METETLQDLAEIQQQKIEQLQAQVDAANNDVVALMNENNALRARLQAVALVIRP